MAHRITTNRANASNYDTGTSPLGVGMTCPPAVASVVDKDLNEWCETLQGASEILGSSRVGAFIGGRGCVENLGGNQYMITVAWQGTGPVSAPPANIACGKDLYNGGNCTSDLCRRVLTTVIRIGVLT